MCRKVITADGQKLETVKQLRTILSDEDIVLEEPVQFSGVLWGDSCLCPIDLEATFNRLGWKFQTNKFDDIVLKAHYVPIDII